MADSYTNTTRSYSTSSAETGSKEEGSPTTLRTGDEDLAIKNTQSEGAKALSKNTPKQLRFKMLSPSNSGTSLSQFDFIQPVIVKPMNQGNQGAVNSAYNRPITNDFSKPSKKTSFMATNHGADLSSQDYHRAVVIGNPTPIEFMQDGVSQSTSISSFTSQKPSKQLLCLPYMPDNKDETIVLPKSGRTHCNSFLGVDRPREGEADYFQFQFPPSKRAVGVVIPFFNEEQKELQRTLEALEIQSRLVWKQKNLSMHVLLIMDGWSKAADSMKDYVRYMFPAANPAMPWWMPLEDKTIPSDGTIVETMFVQKIVPYGKKRVNRCIALGDVPISPGSKEATGKEQTLYITLIVKRDNRRKHNSHEWFFGRNGFSEFYGHEYCFATDCGTLFEPDCLAHLLNYMENHPTVSVATGRQRVMSKAQQGSSESFLSLDTLFRSAQCYDYESSFACFMGAFALFGFLPVIPGPCGLYRGADILGPARDWYFDVVNTDPDQSGMILGNLRIAEDRVLSYAAVLKTPEARRMALIPEATFYFEAECSFEKFLLQRRRWTNGTVAGYIYMCIQNPGIIFRANMNPLRKLAVYLLLLCQLLVYLVVALAPGIFLTSLRSTLGSVFPVSQFPGDGQKYPEYLWYICIILYVFMVLKHTGKHKYIAWMFYVLMIVSWIIIIGAFYTFGDYVYDKRGLPTTFSTTDFQYVSIYTVMMVTLVPLLIAFLHSPKSFSLMCLSIIPYYLFLPTLVGWFSAYAFARTWDLTWGNRPASTEAGHASASIRANSQAALKAKAMTVCIFILVCNFAFIFLVQQFQNYSYTILVMAGFIFTFAAIQMIFSIFYFVLYYDPRRIIQACWSVISFPFRRKRDVHSESEEDEKDAPDYRSEFGTMSKFGKVKSGSSHATMPEEKFSSPAQVRAPMVSKPSNSKGLGAIKPSGSTSEPRSPKSMHITEITPSRSSTAIDMNDPENRDPASILRPPQRTNSGHGQVKRTSSIANAV